MPQPPQLSRAIVDLEEILHNLRQEVQAERLAAQWRHAEILARLEEHKGHQESLWKNKRSSSHKENGATSDKKRERDKLLASIESSEGNGAFNGGALAKESKLQFGTKYQSEVESTKGVFAKICRRMKQVIAHEWFEAVVASLILANAVVMCFELQYKGMQAGFEIKFDGIDKEAEDYWPGADQVFIFFDWFFGIVFVLEACMKVATYGQEYFRVILNWLDFVCVVAFILDKVLSALSASFLDAQVLRLVRLFRLVRLVRLIRTLEKLDMLYIMATAIKGMRWVVVWALALLFLMLMTCALFLSEYLQSSYFDVSLESLSPADLERRRELYKYFGTWTRCMLSMFELTLANWPTATRLLTEEISEWFSVICVLHKLTLGFAVIGVINGVILQETFKVALTDDMVMVRQKKRSKRSMERKMQHLFEALDLDRDGRLLFHEFMIIANQPDVKLWLESLDLETDDLLTLFMLIDLDADGTISLNEAVSQIPRLQGHARSVDLLAVRKGIPPYELQEDKSVKCEGEETFRWVDTSETPRKSGLLTESITQHTFRLSDVKPDLRNNKKLSHFTPCTSREHPSTSSRKSKVSFSSNTS